MYVCVKKTYINIPAIFVDNMVVTIYAHPAPQNPPAPEALVFLPWYLQYSSSQMSEDIYIYICGGILGI